MNDEHLHINSEGMLMVITTMCSNRLPFGERFQVCLEEYDVRAHPHLAVEAKALEENHARYLACMKRRSFDPVRGDAQPHDYDLVNAVANLDGPR